MKSSNPLLDDPVAIIGIYQPIFGNGSKERVQLSLVQGKKYHDKELWCGSGLKYEGLFSIAVIFSDGRRVETTVNSFWDNEPLFFYSRQWRIKFADYNHDGMLDINLGQYKIFRDFRTSFFCFYRNKSTSARKSLLKLALLMVSLLPNRVWFAM